MKKQVKKLMLAKETLRSLEKSELVGMAGGLSANTDCTYTNCCSGVASCGTCGTQCGTRLC